MSWHIHFPRDGETALVILNKFVVSGTAPSGLRNSEVFVKVVRVSPGPAWERHGTFVLNNDPGGCADRQWVAVFDLSQGGWDPTARYDIILFHTPGGGVEDDKDRSALRLIPGREAAAAKPVTGGTIVDSVTLIYPTDLSTVAGAGFSPYGQLSPPATSVPNNGGKLMPGNIRSVAAGMMGPNFYWVSFQNVAPGQYILTVESNNGTSPDVRITVTV